MVEPLFLDVEGRGEPKIASPRWRAVTRRVVKLRPSRMRSTSNRIGSSGIAGEEEIGVQGMGRARLDGAGSGDQRLGDRLAAEDPRPPVGRRAADEPVGADRFDVEEGDEVGGGEGMKVPIGAALVRRGARLVNPHAPLNRDRAGSARRPNARSPKTRWREIWSNAGDSSLDVTLP